METVFTERGGEMDLYTLDHRGTGRSSPMTCVASQTLTTNSDLGISLSPREVEHCFAAFNAGFRTPNAHRGFSVTMAAYDLVGSTACKRLSSLGCAPHTDGAVFQHRAISLFNSGQETSVYGVSYGAIRIVVSSIIFYPGTCSFSIHSFMWRRHISGQPVHAGTACSNVEPSEC